MNLYYKGDYMMEIDKDNTKYLDYYRKQLEKEYTENGKYKPSEVKVSDYVSDEYKMFIPPEVLNYSAEDALKSDYYIAMVQMIEENWIAFLHVIGDLFKKMGDKIVDKLITDAQKNSQYKKKFLKFLNWYKEEVTKINSGVFKFIKEHPEFMVFLVNLATSLAGGDETIKQTQI